MAASAKGHAAARGISEASVANPASAPSTAKPATSSHEGLRANLRADASAGAVAAGRHGADAPDERIECGIGSDLMAEEPVPEPIVLAGQQL